MFRIQIDGNEQRDNICLCEYMGDLFEGGDHGLIHHCTVW